MIPLVIDPTVQVAVVSVFATTITTAGVVAVAYINNRKERHNAADEGFEEGLDERAALGRIFTLMREKEELLREVQSLRRQLGQNTSTPSERKEGPAYE